MTTSATARGRLTRWRWLPVTVIAAITLSACGSNSTNSGDTDAKNITFWLSASAAQAQGYHDLAKEFLAKEGVTVEIVNIPNSGYQDKLRQAARPTPARRGQRARAGHDLGQPAAGPGLNRQRTGQQHQEEPDHGREGRQGSRHPLGPDRGGPVHQQEPVRQGRRQHPHRPDENLDVGRVHRGGRQGPLRDRSNLTSSTTAPPPASGPSSTTTAARDSSSGPTASTPPTPRPPRRCRSSRPSTTT